MSKREVLWNLQFENTIKSGVTATGNVTEICEGINKIIPEKF
jgi:hypothetical protein